MGKCLLIPGVATTYIRKFTSGDTGQGCLFLYPYFCISGLNGKGWVHLQIQYLLCVPGLGEYSLRRHFLEGWESTNGHRLLPEGFVVYYVARCVHVLFNKNWNKTAKAYGFLASCYQYCMLSTYSAVWHTAYAQYTFVKTKRTLTHNFWSLYNSLFLYNIRDKILNLTYG